MCLFFAIDERIDFENATRFVLRPIRDVLRNDVTPLADRALGYAEPFGRLGLVPEEPRYVFLKHGPLEYIMLNLECKRKVQTANPALFYAEPMESMGDRIRLLRVARGMTQEQLAKSCGVTKSAVSQWEGGVIANVRLQTFLKLLETLQTDAHYLIWGPDRAPQRPPEGRKRAS